MKKLFYFTLILLTLTSCARQKLKKTIDTYGDNTFFVYTDDLDKTQNIFNNADILISNLPENETFILPNSMIILWHTTHIPNIKYLKLEINRNPVVYRFDAQALDNTSFINYFLENNTIITTIYTDSVKFFADNKVFKDYNIQNLKNLDRKKILSGTAIAAVFGQPPELEGFKPFSNGQIKILANIYRPGEKVFSEILRYKKLLNFDTIYTNNPKLLNEIFGNSMNIAALDTQNSAKIDSLVNSINCARSVIVLFDYPENIKLTDPTITKAINSLQVIDKDFVKIYLPGQNLLLLDKAKNLAYKYHPQIIYTNNPKLVSHILDTLRVQYKNFPLTKQQNQADTIPFKQKIKTIADQAQNGISLVIYLSKHRDSLKTLGKLYRNHFNNCVIIESGAGIIIYSKYLADTVFVSQFKKLLDQYDFKYIISTKPALARILTQGDTKYEYQDFPMVINPQTGERNKQYNRQLRKLKEHINSGQGIVIIHQDKTDTLREPYEKLVSHFIAPVYSMKTSSTSTIIFSHYLEKKANILQLLDTNYQIVTNKPAILEHIYGLSGQKIAKLPQRCIPPSCATNTRFEPEMNELRRRIILKNAQVVYFIDQTDSIYPNERIIRNEFRFFKFTKFDGGYVIKNYEGY